MRNPRLASRYAKSLIGLAIERGQLESAYNDIMWLQAACKESRELVNVLRSPIIKGDSKKRIIEAVTKGKINDLTNAFIHLLISKSREANLPEILTAFITEYKVYNDIQPVKLTIATPVSEELKNAIVDQIKKTGGYKNVELEITVDENIIGGFALQVGDKLVDASIAYDLKNIARQFENNDFLYKIR
ncbi:MAG: ATP synthase F1 subunit delta [Chitinophagaceae bacterium]|nr:ATP synthase F1 subunit delta [Chitinophagaceae bacterium]MBK8953158.1 ATP synthase F1 subunit delta [Chitinophagaceae bacterium]